MSAALAFYMVFSLAPMLIVVVALAGYVFGREAARAELVAQASLLLGPELGSFVREVLITARRNSQLATVVGLGTVLFGASVAFAHLQDALNEIWNLPHRNGTLMRFLKKRVLSFVVVLGIGLLLLVSLGVTTAISVASTLIETRLHVPAFLVTIAEAVVSLCIATLLFAVIYRFLPDACVAWRDALVGGAVTAVLFTLGKIGIGVYLGSSTASSVYGAASSLFALLVWLYYSAHVLFLGAEFTQVYARHHGSGIVPRPRRRRPDREKHPVGEDQAS